MADLWVRSSVAPRDLVFRLLSSYTLAAHLLLGILCIGILTPVTDKQTTVRCTGNTRCGTLDMVATSPISAAHNSLAQTLNNTFSHNRRRMTFRDFTLSHATNMLNTRYGWSISAEYNQFGKTLNNTFCNRRRCMTSYDVVHRICWTLDMLEGPCNISPLRCIESICWNLK